MGNSDDPASIRSVFSLSDETVERLMAYCPHNIYWTLGNIVISLCNNITLCYSNTNGPVNAITTPEFCTFHLLLLTTCFGHWLNHHQVEKMQV